MSTSDRAAFVSWPYQVHGNHRFWIPPLRRDVYALLSEQSNPFFKFGSIKCFLARRGPRVVGRIAAVENRLHNEVHQDRLGFFGFFECEDNVNTAAALFEAAGSWLHERGLTGMRGPASLSTNYECGLLVDGFDTQPTLLMPHNPPYYKQLVEAFGFHKEKDLLVYQTKDVQPRQRLVDGASAAARRHNITLRSLDISRFKAELALVKFLFNASWERNWGFLPLSDAEIENLGMHLRAIVVPELVVFAHHQETPIGMVVALPDLNVALARNPSGRLIPGLFKLLWAARHITRLRVILLGTIPQWRHRGVETMLCNRLWSEGTRKGYSWAEAGWVYEDNYPMINSLVRLGFYAYKTYRIYDLSL